MDSEKHEGKEFVKMTHLSTEVPRNVSNDTECVPWFLFLKVRRSKPSTSLYVTNSTEILCP